MFQNQSNFNQSVLKKAQQNVLKKSMVIIAISAVFIILAGIIMLILNDIILGTVFITLGAFFFILLIIIIFTSKKTVSSQNKAYQVFFDFDEDLVKITVFQDGEIASFSKVFYKDLYKIEEREDYVLIYPTKSNFFILEKSKMVEGNFLDLRAFLYAKINTKYKLMCKNQSV